MTVEHLVGIICRASVEIKTICLTAQEIIRLAESIYPHMGVPATEPATVRPVLSALTKIEQTEPESVEEEPEPDTPAQIVESVEDAKNDKLPPTFTTSIESIGAEEARQQANGLVEKIHAERKIKNLWLVRHDPVCKHAIITNGKNTGDSYYTVLAYYNHSTGQPAGPVELQSANGPALYEYLRLSLVAVKPKLQEWERQLAEVAEEIKIEPKSVKPGRYFPAGAPAQCKVKFSPREQEIYDIMQKEPDKSPAEIAESVGLTTQSVYAYQSSIRKKLQLMKGKENGTIASDDTD